MTDTHAEPADDTRSNADADCTDERTLPERLERLRGIAEDVREHHLDATLVDGHELVHGLRNILRAIENAADAGRFCPYCGEPGPHVTEPQVVGNLQPEHWVERADDIRCETCGRRALLELEPEEHNDSDAPRCVHCGSHRTFIRADGDTGCNACGGIMPHDEVDA